MQAGLLEATFLEHIVIDLQFEILSTHCNPPFNILGPERAEAFGAQCARIFCATWIKILERG